MGVPHTVIFVDDMDMNKIHKCFNRQNFVKLQLKSSATI